MEVEDMHPLRTEHITDIVPPLKCFNVCGCLVKKKNFRDAMRVAIIEELRENMEPMKGAGPFIPKNEEHADGYPFLIAGYGVNSFFDIMKRLSILFLVITCVVFPVMACYNSNGEQGIVGLENVSWKTKLNKVSLGNMGGSETQCINKRLEMEADETDPSLFVPLTVKLVCPNGQKARVMGKDYKSKDGTPKSPYTYGMMAKGIDERSYCQNDAIFNI